MSWWKPLLLLHYGVLMAGLLGWAYTRHHAHQQSALLMTLQQARLTAEERLLARELREDPEELREILVEWNRIRLEQAQRSAVDPALSAEMRQRGAASAQVFRKAVEQLQQWKPGQTS